jgi:hypothetical protein
MFSAHQLLEPGHVVQVHSPGDEWRHADARGTDIDLGGQGSHIFLRKNFIVSILKASARHFDAQLTEINLV